MELDEALEIGRRASETVRPVGILERSDMLQEARLTVLGIFYGMGAVPHDGYIWASVRNRLLNLVRAEGYRVMVGLDYEPRGRGAGLVLRMSRFESHIVGLRLEGMTREDIAADLGVSVRRIRATLVSLRTRIIEGGLEGPGSSWCGCGCCGNNVCRGKCGCRLCLEEQKQGNNNG